MENDLHLRVSYESCVVPETRCEMQIEMDDKGLCVSMGVCLLVGLFCRSLLVYIGVI